MPGSGWKYDAVQVLVDGGFGRGPDICKAIALGADAVGIGRLQCWALTVGGERGVSRMIEILGAELGITLANLGCVSLDELERDQVTWSFGVRP